MYCSPEKRCAIHSRASAPCEPIPIEANVSPSPRKLTSSPTAACNAMAGAWQECKITNVWLHRRHGTILRASGSRGAWGGGAWQSGAQKRNAPRPPGVAMCLAEIRAHARPRLEAPRRRPTRCSISPTVTRSPTGKPVPRQACVCRVPFMPRPVHIESRIAATVSIFSDVSNNSPHHLIVTMTPLD